MTKRPSQTRPQAGPDARTDPGRSRIPARRQDELLQTICRHTGRPCAAAMAVARDLLRADHMARQASPGFEVTGETRLTGCPATCPAVFSLSPRGVALFCGVDAGADTDRLEGFAQAFLGGSAPPQGGLPQLAATEQPLAIVLSVPTPAPARTQAQAARDDRVLC